MTADFDFEEEPTTDEETVVEETPAKKTNPLRLILLIVLVLVVICCVGGLALRTIGGNIVRNLPIPGIAGPEVEAPPVVADTATPTPPEVVTEEVVPPAETVEVQPGIEASATPGAEEATAVVAPTTEETLESMAETVEPTVETVEPTAGTVESMAETVEPTVETVESMAETVEPTVEGTEMPAEATATMTPVVVPGPTATPTPGEAPETGPTVIVTLESCQANTPPTAKANGPYTAMMGKGQAFVTLEAAGSTDPDGTIVKYEWDFGDGSTGTGQKVTHGYTSVGSYTATLTVTDNCGATGQSTAQVTVVGPTPPPVDDSTPSSNNSSSSSNNAAVPAATVEPAAATIGFCYLVQPGDSLTAIAENHRVPLSDLAEVNDLSNDLIVAGQGLFIPSSEIRTGSPNVYQIQPGDTLTSIASQCGLSVTALATANNIASNASLTPGQFMIIPVWQ